MRKNKLGAAITSTILLMGLIGNSFASDGLSEMPVDDESVYYEASEAELESQEVGESLEYFKTGGDSKIDNKKLSQLRMRILEKKLEQDVEKEDLNMLKIQKSKSDIEKQLNAGSLIGSGVNSGSKNSDASNGLIFNETLEEKYAEDYDLISSKYNIDQKVGFVYKSQSEVMDDFMKSDEYLKMQAEKEDSAKDLLGIIAKDEVEEAPAAPTTRLLSIKLGMLSVSPKGKTAKLNFEHVVEDGAIKNRIKNTVTIKENITFEVEGDKFKVTKIDKNGVVLRDVNKNTDTIISRGY